MPFTQEEERRLVQVQKKFGNSWEKICQIIDDRSFEELYYEFNNRLNPKLQSGRWTTRQSLMLMILLQHYGAGHWSLISQKMVIKSELQVRERFCNVMDPHLGRDSYWTQQMEDTLMRVAGDYDWAWNRLAKISIFKNKSDNCLWRKYRSMCVKMTKQEIFQLISKKQLADKIIKHKEIYDSRSRRYPDNRVRVIFDPNFMARKWR